MVYLVVLFRAITVLILFQLAVLAMGRRTVMELPPRRPWACPGLLCSRGVVEGDALDSLGLSQDQLVKALSQVGHDGPGQLLLVIY